MSRHTKTLTRSFAGGEMSPEMFGRMDDAYFQAGAATLLNMVPRPTGAAARRSGTRLVRETRDGTKIAHLFSFIFSQTQSFAIEASRAEVGTPSFDGGYFRFHQNGGTMLYSQPDRYVAGQSALLYPCRIANVNYTSGAYQLTPLVMFQGSHGLEDKALVKFIAGVPPGGFDLWGAGYYVKWLTKDTFSLADTPGGVNLDATDIGHQPILYNSKAWLWSPYWAKTNHGLKPGDAVVLSMLPYTNGPTCLFWGTSGFFPSQYSGISNSNGQQVMFVPDAGAIMPSGVEANKLYWIVGRTKHTMGLFYHISESFDGPRIDTSLGHAKKSGGRAGNVRVAVMPDRVYGDGPYIGCNEVYYVTNLSPDRNWSGIYDHTFKLAYSKDEAARGGAFASRSYGTSRIKIHRVYESGEIVNYHDTNGPRNFVCKKSNWRSPIEDDLRLVTLNRYNENSGRYPGGRTATRQANYWRELPGRSTGPVIPVSTTASGTTGHLVITTILPGGTKNGFSAGQAISFVRGRAPAGAPIGTYLYVLADGLTTYTFKVSTSLGGTPLNSPSAGSAPAANQGIQAWATFHTDHTIDWYGHGLSNGDTVVFSASNELSQMQGHFPSVTSVEQTECPFGTTFYVREKTADDFRVSATPSGPLIEFGAITAIYVVASADTIYELPHDYSEDELPQISTTQSNDVMTLASKDHPLAELRRRSATRWDLVDIEFGAAAPIPGPLYEVDIEVGETTFIYNVQNIMFPGNAIGGGAGSCRFSATSQTLPYVANDPVYLEADSKLVSAGVLSGFYLIAHVVRSGGLGFTGYQFWLKYVNTNSGHVVATTVTAATNVASTIRFGTEGEDFEHKYVVTAIDKNNEESAPNESFEVSNNLFVTGASNTVGWGASVGAIRYRIYKELSGLFGLIGETDELTFKDDNIGPDLAVSPPIPDTSLREESRVTFDIDGNTVLWPDHGLVVGTPVVFYTSDHMPTRVNEGQTYYVANTSTGGFQITDSLETYTLIVFADDEVGEHMAVSGNFPSAVTYFEGRRIFGGSRALPQDIWMTASGTEADMSYSIPTVESDRIYFRIASREGSAIRHLLPLSQLMMLSDSTEYRLTPANDDVLTPTSISVRPQSFVGAGYPHPALVNNTVVFAAARGGHVRELGYSQDVLGYLTGDLSIRAAHLFDGFTIKDQAYSKAPLPIVWCVSSSGKLLGITYIPEEKVGAWHQHTTPGGEFESVVSIPEGDEDAVYVVVKRGNKRYVERFADQYRGDTQQLRNAYYVDSGLTYIGAATTTISGLDHLEGESVGYLADGVAGTGTVTSGALTLTKAASTVSVGLVYTSQIQTLPLTMMRVDAFGTGKTKNVNKVWVRVFESGAFKSGPSSTNQERSAIVTAHTDHTIMWGGFSSTTPWLYFPSAHGLSDGDEVVFTGTTAPGGLTLGRTYYARVSAMPHSSDSTLQFRVSATPTGSMIEFSSYGADITATTKSVDLRLSSTPSSGSLLTDLVQVTLPASWDDDGQIIIQQDSTLPFTVAGLTIEVASGG
jgi:hypothetical protein